MLIANERSLFLTTFMSRHRLKVVAETKPKEILILLHFVSILGTLNEFLAESFKDFKFVTEKNTLLVQCASEKKFKICFHSQMFPPTPFLPVLPFKPNFGIFTWKTFPACCSILSWSAARSSDKSLFLIQFTASSRLTLILHKLSQLWYLQTLEIFD